jgi:hypothetical protein
LLSHIHNFTNIKNFKMSQEKKVKLDLEAELSDASSNSEEEVEFLPIFGPFLAPYQGPSGNWIFPPGCPNIGWNLPQPESPPQLHMNNDWSDDDQVIEESTEEEEDAQPEPLPQDEGCPHQIDDFVEENVGHEVVSGSDDSGRNSQSDS